MEDQKKIISAGDLYRKIDSSSKITNNITIERAVFEDEIKISSISQYLTTVEFKECLFKKELTILNKVSFPAYYFTNCVFESSLKLSGEFKSPEIKSSNGELSLYRPESLSIVNCNITKDLTIQDCTVDRFLKIEGSEIAGDLSIDNLNIPSLPKGYSSSTGFRIVNSKILGDVTQFYNMTISGILKINECIFSESVEFFNLYALSLEVSLSHFKSRFNAISTTIKHNIILRNSDFDGQFDLRFVGLNQKKNTTFRPVPSSQLAIEFSKFKSTGEISSDTESSDLPALNRSSGSTQDNSDKYAATFVKNIYLRGVEISDTLNIFSNRSADASEKLQEVIINFSSRFTGILQLTKFDIHQFFVSGDNNSNSLTCSHILFKLLEFNKLNNTKSLKFFNCSFETDGSLIIKDTSLGATGFFGMSFTNLYRVQIENSLLYELVTFNSIWFDDSILNTNENTSKNSEYFSRKKEIYRQLKVAMEKQQDKKQAIFFHSRELKYLIKSLKPWSNFQDFQETISLFGSWTNNYGRSWVRPLGFSLIITFVAWICLVFLLESIKFSGIFQLSSAELTRFLKENSPLFFDILNPISKLPIDIRMQKHPTTISSIVFIHRILISFFIFQIVAAFRKHSRT